MPPRLRWRWIPGASPHPTHVIPFSHRVAVPPSRPPAAAAKPDLSAPTTKIENKVTPRICRPEGTPDRKIQSTDPASSPSATTVATYPSRSVRVLSDRTRHQQAPVKTRVPTHRHRRRTHARHRNTPFLLPLVRYSPGTNSSLP